MKWDVAIVGAGMGGAALGYALAMAGHRVVFLEKGVWTSREEISDDPEASDPRVRLANGRWPNRISGWIDEAPVSFYPPLGCGVGGSTLLYAGTLERFARDDFERHDDSGNSCWPISYDALAPFYEQAEELFRVSGGPDSFYSGPAAPLRQPPPMSRSDSYFFNVLQRNGLKPYRAHNAGDGRGGDERGSDGTPSGHRYDARKVFIEPALATGNATVIDQCTVERVDAGADRVHRLTCQRQGEEITVHARCYALAGGALSTPFLLLRSTSRVWPTGVANGSGMVGRNLMFHVSDFVAVWQLGRKTMAGRSILVRDFYKLGRASLGVIQSTGLAADAHNVVHVLNMAIDAGSWKWLRPLKRFLHVPALLAAKLLGRATIFATVLEDHPYKSNRVWSDPEQPDTICFEYTIQDELRSRVREFRRLYKVAFRRHLMAILTPSINLNFGHSCGTCRMGSDSSLSVLNSECRSHDLENLYVVDGSIFPTSGGINPSLTIAANALRAGAIMSARLKASSGSRPVDVET
ncbi:GMC family oxidoreductase [Neorhizobium sp. T786]|uniref:GMC oxidoreductase n=1 Tax=Pseudorhizobium xiangyangii TaxID=2883104 RepID=UPI001CFF7F47|nr:GMC family oxidoreductase [Neorhizobium xiangyangii]MCB5204666.1 GMC family oxidoreductase [Neorhizobium xiangyangii]